jgi:hypothetical protein
MFLVDCSERKVLLKKRKAPQCLSPQGRTQLGPLAIEGILEVRLDMNNPITPPEVRFIEVAA